MKMPYLNKFCVCLSASAVLVLTAGCMFDNDSQALDASTVATNGQQASQADLQTLLGQGTSETGEALDLDNLPLASNETSDAFDL